MSSTKKLRERAQDVACAKLAEVLANGPLLKASVVRRRYRCGKARCKCAGGELHEDVVVTRKVRGCTQTVRVRRGREEQAVAWAGNWARLRGVLDAITTAGMEVLRTESGEGPARRGRAAGAGRARRVK